MGEASEELPAGVSGVEVVRSGERLTVRFSRKRAAWAALLYLAASVGLGTLVLYFWPEQGYEVAPLAVLGFGCLAFALSAAFGRRGMALDKADGYYRKAGDPVCRLDKVERVIACPRVFDSGDHTRTVYDVVLEKPGGRYDDRFLPVRPSEMFFYRNLDEAYAVAVQVADFLGARAVRAEKPDEAMKIEIPSGVL